MIHTHFQKVQISKINKIITIFNLTKNDKKHLKNLVFIPLVFFLCIYIQPYLIYKNGISRCSFKIHFPLKIYYKYSL